jgi:hypothetical protein
MFNELFHQKEKYIYMLNIDPEIQGKAKIVVFLNLGFKIVHVMNLAFLPADAGFVKESIGFKYESIKHKYKWLKETSQKFAAILKTRNPHLMMQVDQNLRASVRRLKGMGGEAILEGVEQDYSLMIGDGMGAEKGWDGKGDKAKGSLAKSISMRVSKEEFQGIGKF